MLIIRLRHNKYIIFRVVTLVTENYVMGIIIIYGIIHKHLIINILYVINNVIKNHAMM
jgi:hypothetical protein